MFTMLYGYPPFDYDDNDTELEDDEAVFNKIRKGFQAVRKPGKGPWFNQNMSVSSEAQDLIASLLKSDSVKRVSASEALLSVWFSKSREAKKCRIKMVERGIKEVKNISTFRRFMLSLASKGHHQAFEPLLRIADRMEDMEEDCTISVRKVMEILNKGHRSQSGGVVENESNFFSKRALDGVTCNQLRMLVANCTIVAKEERLRDLFKSLDTSGNDQVDKKEVVDALRKCGINDWTSSEISAAFGEADLDQDGEISYEEFLNSFGLKSYRDLLRARTDSSCVRGRSLSRFRSPRSDISSLSPRSPARHPAFLDENAPFIQVSTLGNTSEQPTCQTCQLCEIM
mmetsp:Transcript_27465/g.51259  ORF Transcript_27465/g.51259 Transcript_27465/m.51259 type:complete len:342 (-) Transcript_27465:222-1247(-)